MKATLFLIILSILLFSCKNKTDDVIEVIQDFDKIYLPTDQVNTSAQPVDELFNEEFENDFNRVVSSLNQNKTLFPIKYRIYINKNGKVDKIKDLCENMVDITLNKFANSKDEVFTDFDQLTEKLIPIFSKWKFVPAIGKDGNPTLYRQDFEGIFKLNEKGELELQFDLDINLDFNFNKKEDSDYLVSAEEMPTPVGGIAAIQKNVAYPEIARRAGIQGRVFIKAFIDENGNVTNAEVIKGIGAGCDTEALRAVKETKFIPGKSKGVPVKTQVSIPILFKLK